MKIVWEDNSFDTKLVNLSGKGDLRKVRTKNGAVKEIEMKNDGSPKLVRTSQQGNPVEFARRVDITGQIIRSGTVSNVYVDAENIVHEDSNTMVFFLATDGELIPAHKNSKTDNMVITSFESVHNYTDAYQMERYYQVLPSQGSSKKDMAKQVAIKANTSGMKKLWTYLIENNCIARGILNITSAGFLPSTAYVRAVVIDDSKWTLEIAIFKQKKQFLWVEEQKYEPVAIQSEVATEFVDI